MIINTDNNLDIERAALKMMLERQVEGLIYATMYHRTVVLPTITQVPVVLLDCFVADRSLPSVVPDEVQGGRTATDVLLQKGHRRIGFINEIGPLQQCSDALRAISRHWPHTACRSIQASSVPEPLRRSMAIAVRLSCCSSPNDRPRCSATNDSMAMGAYDAVKQLGLTIAGDVAIVGFDNLEVIATQLRPALTTMELPHYAMGQWAVEYLLEHADDTHPDPVQHTIPCPADRARLGLNRELADNTRVRTCVFIRVRSTSLETFWEV